MKNALRIIASVLVFTGGSVLAAGDCAELCDADFYVLATAESVQQLIDEGIDVNARDEVGKSALHSAGASKPEVISVLLAAGADEKAKDQWDRTPLHFVAATGSIENIKLLLDAGAKVNAKTANDWTPIHGAAKWGAQENIMVLLEAGADAAARTEMGETAFDLSSNNAKLVGTEALKILEDNQ
jgi:ankyrin repeat protein